VHEAADGAEGLAHYREEPSDLILTDIVMPEKEGLETILELRRINRRIKIIAMSGGSRMNPKTNLVIAEKFGALRTLAKPFFPAGASRYHFRGARETALTLDTIKLAKTADGSQLDQRIREIR